MSRKFLFGLIALVAIAAAIFVPRLFTKQEQEASRTAAPAAGGGGPPGGRPGGGFRGGSALKVYVYRVSPRDLKETITANGTLLANESVELRTEISGKVVEIDFEEGGRVKKGDLLLKTNDSELAAQLQRTLYRIELAKAQETRERQLIEQGGTSQASFDATVNAVRVLEAEAQLIRAQLEKTEIRAPFDGMVGLRMVSVGSYITPTTVIATLQDLDRLKVDFTISERLMNRVHAGTPITFSVAGRQEKFSGKVYAVEPVITETTRTVLLRARASNVEKKLLPGAYVSVDVTLDDIPDALLIPTNAIVPGLNERSVFVLENGRAVSRKVTTGIRLDREIQIVEGIKPGETVITSGLLQIRENMPVEPIEDSQPPG